MAHCILVQRSRWCCRRHRLVSHRARHPRTTSTSLARELRTIRAGLVETKTKPAFLGGRFSAATLLLLTLACFTFGYVADFSRMVLSLHVPARGLDLKSSAVYTMFPFIAMTSSACGRTARRLDRVLPRIPRWPLLSRLFLTSRSGGAAHTRLAWVVSAPVAAMTFAAGAGALYICRVPTGPSLPILPGSMPA